MVFQYSFHAHFQKIQGYPLNFTRERACFQHFPQTLRKQSKVFGSFRFGNALFHNLFLSRVAIVEKRFEKDRAVNSTPG